VGMPDLDATLGGSALDGQWDVITNGNAANLSSSATAAGVTSATYTPDAADYNSIITFQFTAFDPNSGGPCGDNTFTVDVSIDEPAQASLNPTGSAVCISEPIILSGTINSGAFSGQWIIQSGQADPDAETSGNLSSTTNNAGNYEATFTPDGSYFGDVIFEFIAVTSSSCENDTITKTINVRELPTVTNQAYMFCENSPGSGNVTVDLTTYNNDVTNETDVTIEWYTNSDLSTPVSDETSVTVVDNSDYFAKVTLTSTNCFDKAQVDFNVHPQIIIDAGSPSQEICDGETLDLSTIATPPSQSNADNLSWTSSGDGTFDFPNSLTPVYTPGPSDLSNSPITLTLTGSNVGPCPDEFDQISLTIKPIAVITNINDIILCPGDMESSTPFSADISGGTFSWNATNASQLGLSSSGTGDFPSFTAQANNTGSSIISTITVDYILNGCISNSKTFDIEVKPTPVIDDINDINVCPGETVDIIFNANTTGEVFTWTKDGNIVSSPALTTTDTGDINFIAASNNTGNIITSEFTYSATLNSCTSITKTFKVNLLPEPVIDNIAPIEVCSFDNILTSFSSNVTDATFSWTNDNIATGIPASGSGNINVTAAENLTGSNEVSTIEVTATKDGCASSVKTFQVTVKPKPILNAQSSIEVCAGDLVSEIVLTDNSSGASTISWTATNASNIGLASSSGNGNIPAFTANTNNGTSTITSNVTVTSIWNNCVSNQLTFQIELKPTPIMNAISNDELCAGDIYSVNFGNSLGATTNYNWTNDNTSIGLAASGSGDNITFTASTNNTGSPIVANIIVTPSNNLCQGPSESFTLTLNPTPVINNINDVELCSEEFISIPVITDLTNTNLNLNVSDNSIFASGPIFNGQNIEFTTAINTTGSDIVSNIEVTAEQNGCESTENFTVTLLYRPVVESELDEPTLCFPANVSSRNFNHDSGTGNFSWEITNPSLIGDATPVSGSGNFPGFTLADNQTGELAEGYVKYYSERNGCLSVADSFKITSNPRPVIKNTDTTFCAGEMVRIKFLDNVDGNTNYEFEWSIDNLSIGINNSSGTTNTEFITTAGFTALNPSSTTDNVANITVRSVINGCPGPQKTFSVTVLPNVILTNPSFDETTCSNVTYQFTPQSSVSTTDFRWSLDTAASDNISSVQGLIASGTGDISLDLINTSGVNQDIVYEITPSNNNCDGASEQLTITVAPEIKFESIPSTFQVCSQETFILPITLANNLSNVEYDWVVEPNSSGAVDGSGSDVTGTLSNSVSGQNDTVQYTISSRFTDSSCNGETAIVNVVIFPNPIVNIPAVDDICENESIILEAQLLNGASSGNWSGGSGTFTSTTSQITSYTPDQSEYGTDVTLTYTANDPDGSGPCGTASDIITFTVNTLPSVEITGDPFPNGLYCIRNGLQELTASPSGGVFTGRGIIDNGDGTFDFDPNSATVGGPYTITYSYENANGCINTDETVVEVTNGPNSNFDMETDDSNGYFCSNAFIELEPDQNDGTFTGPGIEILGGIPYFNAASPDAADLDTVNITYTVFEDATSCTAITTKQLIRIPEPEITIDYQNLCDVDNAVQIIINPGYENGQDSIVSFQLEYENSPNRIYEEGQIEQFSSPGVKSITIIGTTALGCTFETTTEINVGNIQKADFEVSNVKTSKPGETPTQFTNQSILDILDDDPSINSIIEYNWDFGVAGTETDKSTDENPTFNYETPGAYEVKLVIESSLGCIDSISKMIDIVPAINSYPYFETFNESSGGWYTESSDTIKSSWVHGFPDGAFEGEKHNTNAGMIWKTALAPDNVSGYKEGENSYLVGPTFDLTSLEKPMISFDMWLDVDDSFRAGAILEYSTDGKTWEILGKVEDELNWYNTTSISPIGGASSNTLNHAWYFNGEERNWVRVAHTLDKNIIADLGSVLFRINFKGTVLNSNPLGMAVDNFYVGERQKLVLLENFTNLNSVSYSNNRTNIDNLMSSEISKDILPLNFHISVPSPDSINMRNSVQMDARASIYNIEESPELIIDGELFNNNILGANNQISNEFSKKITRRALLQPSNLVEIAIDESATEEIIRFEATLSPNTDTTTTLMTYFFIIEKTTTESDELNNIVRKILPDINGVNLNNLSNITTNSYEWEVNSIYTNDDLAVVSIVQDRNTNSILEINISDINQYKHPKNITNITNGFESIGMSLYPNPSRGNIHLDFSQVLKSDLELMILDTNGKIIKTTTIHKGASHIELDLKGIASGVYHIISKNSEGNLNRQKVVIID